MAVDTTSVIASNIRRDTANGWIVVASAFTINFLGDGVIFSLGVLLIELLDTFQQSRAATTLVISLTNCFAHLTGPVVGAVYDVYGGRILVIIGAVLSFIGVFASCFAPNIAVLYATFGVIAGTGMGLMYAPANSCLVKHFTEKRALAQGIAMSGSGLGTFVMNLLVGYLIDQYGWRGVFLVVSALLLNGIACGLVLQEPSPHTDNITGEHVEAREKLLMENNQDHLLSAVFKEMFDFSLLCDYRCMFFLWSAFSINLAFAVPFSLLPDQVSELGMSEYKASWLVSSIGITNAVSRVFLGWLGDRPFVNRIVMFESVIFFAGISLAISPLLTSFETKLIFTCSYGFFIGGYVVFLPVVLADIFGVYIIGKTFGLSRFAVGIAGLIALPIGGWIFDKTGSYNIAFVIAGCEFIVGGVFVLIPRLISTRQPVDSVNQSSHRTQRRVA